MTIFPNAKINIGLWITSGRDDGFHNIETIFYPVGLKDACEFVMQENGSDSDEFTQTGYKTDCRMSDNLVMKAVNLVRKKYNIPALKIHLHKAIPAGSGLGGGSSDAAFMLRYLNRYFRIGLCNNDLKAMAIELGSDCPFFISNIPSHASGKGENLKKVPAKLSGYYILIVNPGIQINTGEAYASSTPMERDTDLADIYRLPPEQWKNAIINDFEPLIFNRYPVIGELKEELYRQGAIYSSMSGSGSSVYGIFRNEPPANIFRDYFTWKGSL